MPEDFPKRLRLSDDDLRARPLTIANPISRDQMAMRTTLLPGLLMGLRVSVSSGWREPVRAFEEGRVFLKSDECDHVEPEHLAGIVYNGKDSRSPNNDRAEGFYELKADVEAVILARGYVPEFRAGKQPFMHSGQTADVFVDGKCVGWLGRLKPAIEQEMDVSGVYAFELDVSSLAESRRPEFEPTSQFPASFRDVSLLVARDKCNYDVMMDIREAVNEAANDELSLENLRLFDIYEGKGIPEGFRSLAYSLSYRSRTRTLRDEEVEGVHNTVRDALKNKGYIIR